MKTIEDLKMGKTMLYAALFLPTAECFYIRENPQYAERDIELYEKCKKLGMLHAWEYLKRFRTRAIISAG